MRIKKLYKDLHNGACRQSGVAAPPCAPPSPSPSLSSCGAQAQSQPNATSPEQQALGELAANNNPHDADFTHDNSYQWFLDYNYRDSSCQHASVLSSLSGSSYKGLGSLALYEELARDLDANLAEADMESFRTRDIHALLSNLPPSACHLMQDGEDSTAGSINTMSICKSELLFSPVKESAMGVPGHFSVDSLDCDRLEHDLILTCQANKHNYTIAFEGSITMESEDNDCHDSSNEKQDFPGETKYSTSSETQDATTYSTEKLQKSFRLSRPLDSSMAQSDSGFTTWSKLKNRTSQSQLRRHPSGNNNQHASTTGVDGVSCLMKSRSAPDLRPHRNCPCLASSSSAHAFVSSGQHEESYTTENRLIAPPGCLKALNVSHNTHSHCTDHSIGSQEASEGMTSSGESRGPHNSRPHNFNLVKLFMKQKSMSNDGIVGSAMDQSSECWPISSEGGDSADSFCIDSKGKDLEHRLLPAKMNLSSDKDYQSDDCEIAQPDTKNNTKQWVDNDTNEYSTCAFEDSLAEGGNNHEAFAKRTHDFIIEEDEISEKSEQDVDKNIYATVNKLPLKRFNVNNNNSFEKVGSNSGSPIRVRGNATTQTKKSLNSSVNSVSISSFSESEATQATRLHRLIPKDMLDHKATSTQLSMDLIDKSMQTSCSSSINISRDRNLLRVVEPSFLEKLKKGNSQKPVYVLYPNYTLPDLGFISKDQDMDKVFLKPLKYAANDKGKTSQKQSDKNKRPFSCNDVEGLRKKGFKHIRDWDSLTFLLPMEYRQILSEMPEIVQQLKDKEEDLMRNKERPLFCVSPPVRHKSRPVSCDCASLLSNNATNVSSSSSTATQPSSGYRGSSTMLTDSSAQNSPAPVQGFNPLFVYKYDSATSSEASFMNDKQRSGLVGNAPPLPKRSISLAEQNKMAINGKVIDVAPPRPPLPKSILRKSIDKVRKNAPNSKRYSMFEIEDHNIQDTNITCMNVQIDQKNIKRRSLQEPYYLLKNNSIVEMKKNNDLAAKRFSQQFLDAAEKDIDETEYFHDEGVGTESSLESGKSHARPPTPPLPKEIEVNPFVFPTTLSQPVITSAELQQLEDFLKHSGITCTNMEEWDNHHMQKVRNQVSKFLSMKQSQEGKESLNSSCSSGQSKKSVSFAEKNEEKRSSDGNVKIVEELKAGTVTPPNSPNLSGMLAHRHYQAKNLAEIPIREEGESSPEGYASPSIGYGLHRAASNDVIYKRELVTNVVDAVDMILEDGTWCPRLVIGSLCPSLYTLLSDGLRETIDTPFGPANNSVWQVVEASARQGPITKSLNELVMRINSEDALSESVLKFNAFIMGLLNVRSLDAFISYLRTRESVLRRHYSATAALRSNSSTLLSAALSPLATSPFALDLLWQLKDMRRSFKLMEDLMSNESHSSGEWAGDRSSSGGKFRRLQRRWEMLSGQESPQRSLDRTSGSTPGSTGSTPGSAGSTPGSGKSRIPRPVTSPVRSASASNIVSPVKRSIPVSVSSAKKAVTSPSGGPANQKSPLPPLPHGHSTAQRTPISHAPTNKKTITNTTRVSRVESFGVGPSAPRPSSLPYRRVPPPTSSSLSRPRRAASTSQPRPTAPVNATTTKMVRTLWHRLPSDSGHLAFNEGERLRLVLEVDQQWLLCCRGQQKGLVPRDAVIPVPDNALQRF